MYPSFEELVIDFQQTWQLHSNLLQSGCNESHIPVEPANLLLQELY